MSSSPSVSAFDLPQQRLLFLVLWTVANTLPWVAMGLLYQVVPVSALAWVGACVFVGIAQWLVLRRYIADLGNWALATFVGGMFGVSGFAAFIFAMFAVPLMCGLSVGVAQWLVLRHKLTGSFWWIISTTSGAIVGIVLAYIFAPLLNTTYLGSDIERTVFTMGIVIEIVSSLMTGYTMLWLLKRNANRKAVNDFVNETLEE